MAQENSARIDACRPAFRIRKEFYTNQSAKESQEKLTYLRPAQTSSPHSATSGRFRQNVIRHLDMGGILGNARKQLGFSGNREGVGGRGGFGQRQTNGRKRRAMPKKKVSEAEKVSGAKKVIELNNVSDLKKVSGLKTLVS